VNANAVLKLFLNLLDFKYLIKAFFVNLILKAVILFPGIVAGIGYPFGLFIIKVDKSCLSHWSNGVILEGDNWEKGSNASKL